MFAVGALIALRGRRCFSRFHQPFPPAAELAQYHVHPNLLDAGEILSLRPRILLLGCCETLMLACEVPGALSRTGHFRTPAWARFEAAA